MTGSYYEGKAYVPKAHKGNHTGKGGKHKKDGCLGVLVLAIGGISGLLFGLVETVRAIV